MEKEKFLSNYYNSKRRKLALSHGSSKIDKSTTKSETTSPKKSSGKRSDDDELTKKALEEIEKACDMFRVKRESQDLSNYEPKAKTNKKFLINTLNSCISHNRREIDKTNMKSTSKLQELERYHKLKNTEQKFGERKHDYKKPEKRKGDDDDDDEDDDER